MSLEKLLNQTKFKGDAKEIARQFSKVGITTVDRVADAPGLMRDVRVWGHPLSEVIAAIQKADEKEKAGPDTPKAKMEISKPGEPVAGETK